MHRYPKNTHIFLHWNKIIQKKETPALCARMSSRMVKSAAHLPENEFIGWQMYVPAVGLTQFESFGTTAVNISDLEWIVEESATLDAVDSVKSSIENAELSNWNLYEIQLTTETSKNSEKIGFGAHLENTGHSEDNAPVTQWPMNFSNQFKELVRALRHEGAWFRYTVGKASLREQENCKKAVMSVWSDSAVKILEYIGLPVRARVLLLLPHHPSIRLRTVISEIIPSANLCHIGIISEEKCYATWENPMIEAKVLPDIAARILAIEPVIDDEPLISVESCQEEAKPMPAGHSNPTTKYAVQIGKALGTSGLERNIYLGDTDLRRHWQIVGQTGTGKSTLLATAIREAIVTGRGVTFFDPHGSTIDVILKTIPSKYADRIRVVHLGDENNPVPINMWNSNHPDDCEKTISDLNLLFADIFDPQHSGIVGPRWERWFSILASSAIALLGKRASFDSIITLSQCKENLEKLATAIKYICPKSSQALMMEYVNNHSLDWSELINWCISKFQRITSISQLRNTLGAGANALDFNKMIDTNNVTLIDLASPTIGTNASRIVGTLLLLQLWNAVTTRQSRDMTHIVAIDEAHLFQTNPLPQMLAEGRKFGIAMILAHQHNGQLTTEVKDSLDANSANFTAFRLSIKDAADAAYKLDNISLHGNLCRLNAFNAYTTISVDGKQTPVFTLQIDKPKIKRTAKDTIDEIEQKSITQLVDPYRSCHAITSEEIMQILDNQFKNPPSFSNDKNSSPKPISSINVSKSTPPQYLSKLQAVMQKSYSKSLQPPEESSADINENEEEYIFDVI